jgi:hypothetical protein
MGDSKPKPPSPPLRVTSLNPLRDAQTVGHDVATPLNVADAKATALRHRYQQLLADVAAAESAGEREIRLESLLVHLGHACDAIAADVSTLANGTDGIERRDELLHEITTELITLADLSSVRGAQATSWRDALAELRATAEAMVTSNARDAAHLAALDLIFERIDHAERRANRTLVSYLGYISA